MIKFFYKVILITLFISSEIFANDEILAPTNNNSNNNIYLIEAINGKATSKNPNLSKINASKNARREAFIVLLTKLNLASDIANKITDEEIDEMIRSEQILDEKIAGNFYSASFNINFAKNFVDHILDKKKNESKETKKDEEEFVDNRLMILPIKMVKKKPLLWEDENDWKTIFGRIITKRTLEEKYIIPPKTPENIVFVNAQNINEINFDNLEKINKNLKTDAVYILNFYYDEIENKILIEAIYLKKLFKKQFKLSFVNVDRLSYNDLIMRTADKTLEYIHKNPVTLNDLLNKNFINMNLKISNLDDWIKFKKTIENEDMVDLMEIIAISRDEVKIRVKYTNNKITIEEMFANNNFLLTKIDNNSYEINQVKNEK
jgi:hypothetical protein